MYNYTRLANQDDMEPNYDTEMEDTNEITTENIQRTNSVGVQTDYEKYISFKPLPETIDLELKYEDAYFKHLVFANQTYWEHFKDAIKYSMISLKASIFFFCHAIWPDLFTRTGSDITYSLSEMIYEKYQKRIREIMELNDLN